MLHFNLGDESGTGLFHSAAIVPWVHVTVDLQIIRPGNQSLGNATLAGVSARIKF